MPGVVTGFVTGRFLHPLAPLLHFDLELGIRKELDSIEALLGYREQLQGLAQGSVCPYIAPPESSYTETP